jgi:uroporphyrinogen-III decarboxylase
MTVTMKPFERVLAAINMQESDRIPCAVSLSFFVAKANGITIADFINDSDLCMELQQKTFESLGGSDLVNIMPPRSTDTPDGFAFLPVKVKLPGKTLPPDVIPQYVEKELMTPEDYKTVVDKGWFRYVEENLVPAAFPESPVSSPAPKTKQRHDYLWNRRYFTDRDVFIYPEKPVSLPFETLSYARSLEKFLIDLYRRPDMVLAAMDAIMSDFVEAALADIDSLTTAVVIAASRFSGGFISPQHFEKFALPQLLQMVDLLVNRNLIVFFHLDQNWTKMLPYFKQFPPGRYVLHFDGTTDIFKAKEILGDRMCLMGDVPAKLFTIGTPRDIETYCKKLIDTVGRGGGFILGAG